MFSCSVTERASCNSLETLLAAHNLHRSVFVPTFLFRWLVPLSNLWTWNFNCNCSYLQKKIVLQFEIEFNFVCWRHHLHSAYTEMTIQRTHSADAAGEWRYATSHTPGLANYLGFCCAYKTKFWLEFPTFPPLCIWKKDTVNVQKRNILSIQW